VPKLKFVTKIYHPNVFEGGHLCLPVFHEKWAPNVTLQKIFILIDEVLLEPNMEYSCVPEIANKFRNDPVGYYTTAKEWTRKFAA
jgi:ubiquitin-protein ligase